MTQDRLQKIQAAFVNDGPILRAAQLRKLGVCSKDIQELLSASHIVRIKEGYYAWQDQMACLSDNQIATSVIPGATLYFLSAAEIYEFTTVIPEAVHIAVLNVGKEPKRPDFPPIEITRFKESLFLLGRTQISMESGMLPIYDRERTICDFLKRRDEVGNDIALEVLRGYMRGAKDIQKLYEYAEQMRIRQILHPYLEVLL